VHGVAGAVEELQAEPFAVLSGSRTAAVLPRAEEQAQIDVEPSTIPCGAFTSASSGRGARYTAMLVAGQAHHATDLRHVVQDAAPVGPAVSPSARRQRHQLASLTPSVAHRGCAARTLAAQECSNGQQVGIRG
jgi:hypothetical protein